MICLSFSLCALHPSLKRSLAARTRAQQRMEVVSAPAPSQLGSHVVEVALHMC